MPEESRLREIHERYTSDHRKEVEGNKWCGCFQCKIMFHPMEIVEWIDDGITAVCPHCGVDAILPDIPDIYLSHALLLEMNDLFFSEAEEEQVLTRELHTKLKQFIEEGKFTHSQKTVMQMYLFMLEYIDILKQPVNLGQFITLIRGMDIELPLELAELE